MDQINTSEQTQQQEQAAQTASRAALAGEVAAVMQTLPDISRTLYQGFLLGLQAAEEAKKAG